MKICPVCDTNEGVHGGCCCGYLSDKGRGHTIESYSFRLEHENIDKEYLIQMLYEQSARIKELESALKSVKVRICYIGHPKEKIVDGRPDWTNEISLIEAAIKSTPEAAGGGE